MKDILQMTILIFKIYMIPVDLAGISYILGLQEWPKK